MKPRVTRPRVVLALAATVVGLAASCVSVGAVEEPAAAPGAERVVVACVDAEGKPVAGAEVHLFQYVGTGGEGRFVHSGPFPTDEQGKAAGSEAATYDGGKHDRWFYARVPGRLVGVGRSAQWSQRKPINPDNKVVMVPSKDVEGLVTVPAGFEPTQVVVSVRTLHVLTGPDEMDYQSFPRSYLFPGLDSSLPEIFECRADAEGRFRFGDVPARSRLYLDTSGPGLAEAQWSNYLDRDGGVGEPIRMVLEKEGLVTGRVLGPDGKPAAGIKVDARLSSSGRLRVAHLSTFRASTGDDGRFAIHGLPETEFSLSVVDPTKTWTTRPLRDLLAPPGRDPALTIRMEAGVRVSGTVKDPEGKPVEGAAISAIADAAGGSGLDDDMSKADGTYELRLPSGVALLYFNSLPDGFEYPKPQIVKQLDVDPSAGDVSGLDFTLQRQGK